MESCEINTSSKKNRFILTDLPMLCLVEITGFLDSNKNCLTYRNISKKFNEAIQIKIFAITKNEKDGEFYQKCFIILNSKCHKYFNENVYPLLINVDTVYDFFNYDNEEKYKNLFNFSFNEFKNIITSHNIQLKKTNIEKTFKKSLLRFLVTMIIMNLDKHQYDSLYFSELIPYEEAREMIVLIVKYMDNLEYLDISKSSINDDTFFEKLIDKVALRKKFTLNLEGMILSNNTIKKAKVTMDKNLDIKIDMDKRMKEKTKELGGKKMNKNQKNKYKIFEFYK